MRKLFRVTVAMGSLVTGAISLGVHLYAQAPVAEAYPQDLTGLPTQPGIRMSPSAIRTYRTPSDRMRYISCFVDTFRCAPEQRQRLADELITNALNLDMEQYLAREDQLTALRLLAQFRPIPRVKEFLRETGSRSTLDVELRARAVESWSWHLQGGYAVSDVAAMEALLRSPDLTIRKAAILGCGYCNMAECRPLLLRMLRDSPNENERQEIRTCLEWLSEPIRGEVAGNVRFVASEDGGPRRQHPVW